MKIDYRKIYKNKKILITGSTGFKGSWLSFLLYEFGSKVIGVSKKSEKNSIIFKSLNLKKKIKQYYIDIANYSKLNNLIKKEKPNIVFHLAAQSVVSESYKNPLENYKTNVMGSVNILECVKNNKIKNLVYITSDKCYQNFEKNSGYKENDYLGGHDNYSASKACAEIAFHAYNKSFFNNKNLSCVSARAGNVIGGGDFKSDRIVPDIIRSLSKNKKILIRSPKAIRPWQHVMEPLSGYLLLGAKLFQKKLNYKLYPSWNFGPNLKNCKTVKYLVNYFKKHWGDKKIIITFHKKKNFYESKLLKLNIKKAKKELGWKPTLDINTSLKLTIDWYKAFFEKKDMEVITKKQIRLFFKKIDQK